jgi:hypothetical protein
MFLQVGKCDAPYLALHQFFHTLQTIWAQVAAQHFCKIQDGGPLKNVYIQHPNTRAIPVD